MGRLTYGEIRTVKLGSGVKLGSRLHFPQITRCQKSAVVAQGGDHASNTKFSAASAAVERDPESLRGRLGTRPGTQLRKASRVAEESLDQAVNIRLNYR